MKTLLLYIFLIGTIFGCSGLAFLQEKPFVVTKTGYVELNNNELIFFKCALVEVSNHEVKIASDKLRYDISWKNIRVISIYNECLQQDYIEHLKSIKEYADKRVEIEAPKKENTILNKAKDGTKKSETSK
jgi:hypothetical protein